MQDTLSLILWDRTVKSASWQYLTSPTLCISYILCKNIHVRYRERFNTFYFVVIDQPNKRDEESIMYVL